jgi:leucyl/phenylalanyl-tRNA--protein transferase
MPFPKVIQENDPFPNPLLARKDGLVAIGGSLTVARLLLAYRSGIFPWTESPISWWSPDPRGIFELEGFHVSRSLQRTLAQKRFAVTFDRAFGEVMAGCAESAPGRRETWISTGFVSAYTKLHLAGYAHSVECWREDKMVGGLYGVSIGGFFAGESMFHRETEASKVALFHIIQRLREKKFELFDIQMVTPATKSLGATEISRRDYLARLKEAVNLAVSF